MCRHLSFKLVILNQKTKLNKTVQALIEAPITLLCIIISQLAFKLIWKSYWMIRMINDKFNNEWSCLWFPFEFNGFNNGPI